MTPYIVLACVLVVLICAEVLLAVLHRPIPADLTTAIGAILGYMVGHYSDIKRWIANGKRHTHDGEKQA